ncbi:acyltransferase family protein [Arthrobacter sp. 3Tela_A]|uniref:acyltransferase family protein n=1 Tax=Arthrobacter sp. 3Tela_A TaxID=3093743 RepID=UPI003BB5CB10
MASTLLRSQSGKSAGVGPLPAKSFRSDIQGLRAIAVGTVLLYHAGAPFVPGGFVGVDVFFVISGFLITGLLIKEIRNTGQISLLGFYARRAKRILPAATIVLLAVAALTVSILPRGRWDSIGSELLGSAFNIVNWVFADSSTDYLQQDQAASPVQHFWTLAVEEQFYIVWPLLLVGACLLARSRKRTGRGSTWHVERSLAFARAGVFTLTIPSFVFSIYYTELNPGAAYFVTTTRLWELGIGAIVALFATELARIGVRAAKILGWVGLAAITASAIVITGGTAFPGFAALLPTLGAAAIIVAGMNGRSQSGVGALLSLGPFTWIGNISYSLYLWHWPLIVVGTYLLNGLSFTQGLTIIAVSFIPAILSYRYLERPVLRWRYLEHHGTALGLTTIVTCCVAITASSILLVPKPSNNADFTPTPLPVSGSEARTAEPIRGAELLAMDPSVGKPQDRPGEFVPLAMYAAEDTPDTVSRGCHQNVNEDQAEHCVFGDEAAEYRIAIVGDSHAAQWTPALGRLAQENGWRVDSYTKSSCAFVGTMIMAEGGQKTYDSCLTWHDNVMTALTGPEKPDLVLTSGQAYDTADGRPLADSLAATWAVLRDSGITVAALGDTPRPGINVPECAMANEERLTECAVDRVVAMKNGLAAQQTAAEIAGGMEVFDMTDHICPAEQCSVVIGNVFVYRDSNHLTATYVRTMAPSLKSKLADLGAPEGSQG